MNSVSGARWRMLIGTTMTPMRAAASTAIDEFEAIAEQQREAVAFAKAALRQIAGDGFDLVVQRTIADALVTQHQRGAIRCARDGFAKHRVDMRRAFREAAHDAVAVMHLVAKRGHL